MKKTSKIEINQRSNIEWSGYLACAHIEGFAEGENGTDEEKLEAFAYLIKTGQAWSLQGFYGRGADNLIETGYISKDGEINWNKYDSINE